MSRKIVGRALRPETGALRPRTRFQRERIRTLAEAFSGWRDSPSHRANMLHDGVTRMGIATAYAPASRYKVFWSMVLAKPADPRDPRRAGPNAGPPVGLTIGGR